MNDPLLSALVSAGDPAAREQEIERLIVRMSQPLAERILSRYRLQPQDAEDVISTVNLRVVRKLRALLESDEEAIGDLGDYVATLTYHAIHDHLRGRYPERTRLKNRLRYLLTHDDRLALWTAGMDYVAGLAGWKGSAQSFSTTALPRRDATRRMLDRAHPADALVEIFRAIQRPMLFETLLETAADLWQITDAPTIAAVAEEGDDSALTSLEQRDFLRMLWREIRLLPLLQRKALLLNLRDSEIVNPVALLVLTATTSFDEIAAAMEMSREALAALWNDLPLDDLRIAAMLGMSRQQVINLRKSARKRLGRRIFPGRGRS